MEVDKESIAKTAKPFDVVHTEEEKDLYFRM